MIAAHALKQNLQRRRTESGLPTLARTALGFACGVFILLGFNACSLAPKNDPRQGITLKLSAWGSAQEITVIRRVLQEFESQNPRIHVRLMHVPDNYYQKLHLLIAGDMAPDVMMINSPSFPVYAAHGAFLNLRPLLASDLQIHPEDFYPAALSAFSYHPQGNQQSPQTAILGALPRDISNLVVFYNRDLFLRAKVPEPTPSWNWPAFVRTAKALTQQTNTGKVFGISFYSKPPLFWLPFVWSAGGNLFSSDVRKCTLDSPEALAGLKFYANLRHRWHIAPSKADSGDAAMSQLFLQQKLAMMVSGRWSVPVLREQARFQWDIAPLPVGPSGQSQVGIDASGYAISSKTTHPQEAWALTRFLASRESIRQITASGLIVPSRPDVAKTADFMQPGQLPKHGKVFLDVIANGKPTQTPPRWNEFSESLQLALEPVWDGTETPEHAVRQALPQLQSLLEVSPQ